MIIALAADSGCGKSTFMRRMTGVFGADAKPPEGGNPDSNTLLSDMTTVICLDDYHSLDRTGRKETGITALDPRAQDFDLMYEQVKAIKDGKAIEKPIYNHVSGLLDPAETIEPPKVRARRRRARAPATRTSPFARSLTNQPSPLAQRCSSSRASTRCTTSACATWWTSPSTSTSATR